MQSFVDELIQQATEADMIVNGWKTREMLISPIHKDLPQSVTLSGTPVERVMTLKLLGVHAANDLKWMYHVDAVMSKISLVLYFLKQLKRLGAERDSLLCFHSHVVAEYAFPVWHSSLTAVQRRSSRYSVGRWELSFLKSTTHRHLPLPESKCSYHDGRS